MRYIKVLSSISIAVPIAACGGNTIQLGGDHGADAANTGGFGPDGSGSGGAAGAETGGAAGAETGGAMPEAGGGVPEEAGCVAQQFTCPVESTAGARLLDAATTSPDAGMTNESVCQCTRRPGGALSNQCVHGDGTSACFVLTPDGGAFSIGGRQAKAVGVNLVLDFPRGAVSEPTTITLTETTCAPPNGFNDASPLYELWPADLVFASPVSIKVPFSTAPADYSQGPILIPRDLGIYQDSTTGFERLSSSYTNGGFMQGLITHFGFLFVGDSKTEEQASCP